jgi:predicted amidophosphoribosyltransferase
MIFLDLIFPKRCVNCKKLGDYLCSDCFIFLKFSQKQICFICKKYSPWGLTHKFCKTKYSIDGCFNAVGHSAAAGKMLFSFKNKPYLLDLRHLISDLFYESIIENEKLIQLIEKHNFYITFIPLSGYKLKQRGYNQAEVLAREIAGKLKLKVTKFEDLSSSIQNVLVVDDLVKTGKTLTDFSANLKAKGVVRVYGLVFAAK